MKPQEEQQQPKTSQPESKSHSSKTESTWNDRDKSSSLTPKDGSVASTKQYDDVKPRESKKDDTRQEKGPRFDQNVNRNSDRKN